MRSSVLAALLALPGGAFDNGAPNSRLPALGWSSWVALGPGWPGPDAKHPKFDFCDYGSVKASIDAFFTVGLFDAGYRHFHLDDCWADPQRNASGFLQPNREHFPRGLTGLIEYAHGRGLTFGLYTCAGNATCVGNLPGSKDHYEQDAAVFAEWGVDWVKMDWCNTKGMDPKATYRTMSEAMNKTGRHMHLNMCEWGVDNPWKWGPDIAQSWRSHIDHVGTWQSTLDAIRARNKLSAEEGGAPYAWNDMDMLETGNYKQAAHANGKEGNMTAIEYQTEFTMWAIFASPMVVTTPILNCSTGTCHASITPLQQKLLLNTEIIAINQDTTPAGKRLNAGDGGLEVYGRSLSNGDLAVVVLNPTDSSIKDTVDFATFGDLWPSGTSAMARDLWRREDLGVYTDRFPATGGLEVEPHQTVVLRLTPCKRDPEPHDTVSRCRVWPRSIII